MALMEECIVFSNPTLPIIQHAWNDDRKKLALCPGNNQIVIISRESTKSGSLPQNLMLITDSLDDGLREHIPEDFSSTKQYQILQGHDKLVTSIDWAPETKRIVSCGQDRNAYVWTPAPDGVYKPTLVILRINRAATFVRWSPQENKFAVGSGSCMIAVAYFEPDNDWWVSKHIKKLIKSTVLSIDWHPNNSILACGSADGKVRVFSAYIRHLDHQNKNLNTSWGSIQNFGDLLAEFSYEGQGWIHSVSFSSLGDWLAWTCKLR
jgi:actin related protein 2/3 complex subunit 1A/1B